MTATTAAPADLTKFDLRGQLDALRLQVGFVLARQWTEGQTSEGGIQIPNSAADQTLKYATVLKVGPPDPQDTSIDYHEGEIVVISEHVPVDVSELGDNLILLKALDCHGAFDPAKITRKGNTDETESED